MPDVKFQILVKDKRWKTALPGYKQIIEESLKTLLSLKLISNSQEISILLTSDAEIQKLNNTYRQQNKPTNVLSFPQDDPELLGDVILALETLQREAKEQEKTFSDHFIHLFVHGVLHLVGYDHIKKSEQTEMEKVEIKILKQLGIENPY